MAQVKPIIAVVGRPNVGKSTFFNKMVGARVSIVEDTPGVTRDRVYADSSWQNYEFTLVDTGGIDPIRTTRCCSRCAARPRSPWTRRTSSSSSSTERTA